MGKLSFGTTGLSYQVDKVDLKLGGAPQCPRCAKAVYFNEEKKAHGRSWHTKCFTCAKCNKRLDSTNAASHEGEVFCSACHRREFGPKGYGFAGGASGLSTESTIHNVRPVTNTQTHAVPHTIPAKKVDRSDPGCCPRCGKRVFFAEEVKAMKRSWHRLCFKCGTCNKMLEPGRCSEHEGELYCQACYGRQFGPKGYGFAGGAGQTLSSDSHPYFPHRTKSSGSVDRELGQHDSGRAWKGSSSGSPSPSSSSNSSMHSPNSTSHYPAPSNSMVFPAASANSMVFPAAKSQSKAYQEPAQEPHLPSGSQYLQNGSSTKYYAAPVQATMHSSSSSSSLDNTMSPSAGINRYAQQHGGGYREEVEEVPIGDGYVENTYARAQPAPAGRVRAEDDDPQNTRYYGAKEWNEPVFL